MVAAALRFCWQVYSGIGVAGLRRPVFWGFYITNFVFWIGLEPCRHADLRDSAPCNATWRRPVTRCAEVITVFALSIGATFPVIHLGRPWLAFWLFPYPSERGIWPNIRSPLLWDFFAINTYLLGSVTFLLLPMIPDMALIRDRATGLRKQIYAVFALGWRGTPKQWHRLESAMQIMAIAVIPVAVSVHSIVSWDFAMAPVPDVALDDFRSLFRCRRNFQRHRGADHRHGAAAEIPAPRGILAARFTSKISGSFCW